MTDLLIPLPGNEAMAQALSQPLGMELGHVELHKFPDGETYIRLLSDVDGRQIVVVCTLDRPGCCRCSFWLQRRASSARKRLAWSPPI
jgi:ribose-phosphate pyrophosphokinase